MKTITFEIEKKNRKYFKATKDGYACKILIDDNSQALELGTVELCVDDISVRSKYGTDLIYKLAVSADEQQDNGIVTLQHYCFNAQLVKECRELGGKWDSETKAWIFKSFVEDRVEALDYTYNSKLVDYEITFTNEYCRAQAPVSLFGVVIATATGRDSGAKLGNNIALIAGEIRSGGSAKNWLTGICEGAVIRLQLPQMLVEQMQAAGTDDILDSITITEV